MIEAKNASGQILHKSAGTFLPGVANANTVSALQGYVEPAPTARFNQPVSAQSMALSYRPAGSKRSLDEAEGVIREL